MGSKDFLDEEDVTSKNFESKPRTMINSEPTTFNGMEIQIEWHVIWKIQRKMIKELIIATIQKEFASEREDTQ